MTTYLNKIYTDVVLQSHIEYYVKYFQLVHILLNFNFVFWRKKILNGKLICKKLKYALVIFYTNYSSLCCISKLNNLNGH